MGTLEKAITRLKSLPKGYTYTEAKSLLQMLGYVEYNKGKTSGSRVCFYRKADEDLILLHKPHPSNTLDPASTKALFKKLESNGEI